MKATSTVIIGIILAALASYLIWHGTQERQAEIRRQQELEEALTGEIEAPSVDHDKPFMIKYGGMTVILPFQDVQRGLNLRNLINFGMDFPVKVDISEDKIYVTTEVKNDNGETIGKITINNWSVDPNPLIAYDRNYNDFAFEVIDSDLIPRIQIILRPNNVIFIGGYFTGPNGSMISTGDFFSRIPAGYEPQPTLEYLREKIHPIFVYPSSDHFGELDPELYNQETGKFWFEEEN